MGQKNFPIMRGEVEYIRMFNENKWVLKQKRGTVKSRKKKVGSESIMMCGFKMVRV